MARPFLVLAWACGGSGGDGDTNSRTDEWVQGPVEQTDVLFVIDDGPGMLEYQSRISGDVPPFLEALDAAGVDALIGVVPMSSPDGQPIGDPPMILASQVDEIGDRIRSGGGGSPAPPGLSVAAMADDLGLWRSDQSWIVLGSIYDDASPDSQELDDVADIVDALDPGTQLAAVVGQDNSPCATPAGRFREAAELTGGEILDVCSGDLEEAFGALGDIASGIRTSWRLSRPANVSTLAVYVDDIGVPNDSWWYDAERQAVEFFVDVPPGATIRAVYATE